MYPLFDLSCQFMQLTGQVVLTDSYGNQSRYQDTVERNRWWGKMSQIRFI